MAIDEESGRSEDEELIAASDWLEIGNEFAGVRVRKVLTRTGARLEITAPRRELTVYLDSTVLEALTWQTPESLSLLLETPLEPFRRDR
jgi:hypothetical protein